MTRRRWLWLAGAVGGCIVAGLLSWLLLARPAPSSTPVAHTPTPTASAQQTLTPAAAQAMAADLLSRDPSRVARHVATSAGSPSADFVAALGSLRSLTFQTSTFQTDGNGNATVQAEMVDATGHATHWLAYLVLDNGQWRLVATAPLDAASPTPSTSLSPSPSPSLEPTS
jgi:hypothetical protein